MPTATINGRSLHWADEHYEGFWASAERGDWEPHTFRTLDRHLHPDATVIDVGAHIGVISLYAATIAKRVISLEPDPVSVAKLRRNIAVNPALADRIAVIPRALSPSRGSITLGSLTAGGDSMSSTVFPRPQTSWTVDAVTPEDMAADVGSEGPLFVKIDIEGSEYDLVPAARPLWDRNDVTILLSTHPQILQAAGRDARLRHRTREMFRALKDFDRTPLGRKHSGPLGRALDSIGERWPTLTAKTPRDWLFVRSSREARREYRRSARSAAHR